MREFLTYSLDDFFLFSSEAFIRRIEIYNISFWPVQILFFLLGLGITYLVLTNLRHRDRGVNLILAFFWGWGGYGFHHLHYSQINFIAQNFAYYFYFIGIIFLLVAAFKLVSFKSDRRDCLIACGLISYPLLLIPLINLGVREVTEVTFFGWGVDEIALGSFGLIYLIKQPFIRLFLFAMCFAWIVCALLVFYNFELLDFYLHLIGLIIIFGVFFYSYKREI